MHTKPTTAQHTTDHSEKPDLVDGLIALREDVAREAQETFARWRPNVRRTGFLPSAHNLAAYLAFRRRDVRPFQDELAAWGLSSLGRSEGHVLPISTRSSRRWPF